MKKLYLLMVMVMFITLPLQAQEYFSKHYNTMVTSSDEIVEVDIFVEFNVFNSTDIVMHMKDATPSRFVQVGKLKKSRDKDGVEFQEIKVKLSHKNNYFTFMLVNTGELIILNHQSEDIYILAQRNE